MELPFIIKLIQPTCMVQIIITACLDIEATMQLCVRRKSCYKCFEFPSSWFCFQLKCKLEAVNVNLGQVPQTYLLRIQVQGRNEDSHKCLRWKTFAKIANCLIKIIIVAKRSILDVYGSPRYASAEIIHTLIQSFHM